MIPEPTSDWELVVGVEVHAQLSTATKLFCGCSTRFGAAPNTQTCPVCLGLPGVLPVVNARAFEDCLRIAVALRCAVPDVTGFERKNYYYPDLPKNYQITQDARCLGRDGSIDLPNGRRVRIHNVHLEEDAGKLVHPEGGARDATLVDLNRAGTPLAEIVTQPDLRSTDDVREYMEALRRLLLHTDVCDCRMEEGSLRFEASMSVRRRGESALGTRVEVKNLNSTAAVLKVVEHEQRRQIAALERGETIARETRLWNDEKERTERMRGKEAAHDYRYFPEPDIPPIPIDRALLERVRASLPELPEDRRRRFVAALGLSEYEASVLTAERPLAEYFEDVVRRRGGDVKEPASWVMNLVLGACNERGLAIADAPVSPAALADLLALIERGGVSKDAARKEVFPRMMASGRPATDIVAELGLQPMDDIEAVRRHVREAMAGNAKAVADWRAGKTTAAKALMGAIMRATRGKADPATVTRILDEELAKG